MSTVGPPAADHGVRAEYAALAAGYERRWARYLEASLALLRPGLGEHAPGRLLDVACGTAALLPRLRRWSGAEARYVGIDASAGMLSAAGGGNDAAAAFAVADAAALPFASGGFDTVVCASALHYFADPARVLAEARRVLAPEGRLLLLDWSRDALPMRLMEAWLRLRRRPLARVYSALEAAELVRCAGFVPHRLSRGSAPPWWRLFLIEARVPPRGGPASAGGPRS